MSQLDRNLSHVRRIKQLIHNLRMKVPTGIRSVDDANDKRRKYLEEILIDEEKIVAKLREEQKLEREDFIAMLGDL